MDLDAVFAEYVADHLGMVITAPLQEYSVGNIAVNQYLVTA